MGQFARWSGKTGEKAEIVTLFLREKKWLTGMDILG
jgi:hypothetical protein